VKTYPSAKIRNVALVGHGGSGKTTLAEALLHVAGVTQRMGRVEDGTTASDFDPEEHKRGISVGLSVLPFEYEGHKINLLDCPGYADFVGDVVAALRVADLAVFVISAVDGVEVQAEIAWKMAEAPSRNGGPHLRASSPPGFSILITSAPRSPSTSPAQGAATLCPSSTTTIPCSGAVGEALTRA